MSRYFTDDREHAICLLRACGIRCIELAGGDWESESRDVMSGERRRERFRSFIGLCDRFAGTVRNEWFYEFCAGLD